MFRGKDFLWCFIEELRATSSFLPCTLSHVDVTSSVMVHHISDMKDPHTIVDLK